MADRSFVVWPKREKLTSVGIKWAFSSHFSGMVPILYDLRAQQVAPLAQLVRATDS